jgi:hypothetical protein
VIAAAPISDAGSAARPRVLPGSGTAQIAGGTFRMGPFSSNVVPGGRLFSINLVPKQRMFLGQAIYVLSPLHLVLLGLVWVEMSIAAN